MVWNFVVNCSDPFSLLYLLSSDNSATHLPSVWSWKGCLLWSLAFDLKATKLSWILKYFTCSPSTCNSYFSQNNGQVVPFMNSSKNRKVQAKDIEWPWILPVNSSVLFNSCPELFKRWFPSSLWLLLEKSTKMKEKNAASWHKKTKLGVDLVDRARPKSPFFREKGVKKRRSEKNRVRNSWKEIF